MNDPVTRRERSLEVGDVEIAAILHYHYNRRVLGYYRLRDRRRHRPVEPKPRPTWQTWNTRNMSDADELALILTFAHAGLDIVGAR
jgi:hypothetical protein